MKKLLFIFFSLSSLVYGQTALKGFVLDKKTHQPVVLASVYINGSSKGTQTDSKGYFSLEAVQFPSLLVISQMNFELKTIQLDKASSESLTIVLNEKKIELNSVTVNAKSRRKETLEEFRKVFLGTDVWGLRAKLLNDSVLYFSRKTDSVRFQSKVLYAREGVAAPDSGWASVNIFGATTRASLLVDLPLLGYTLSVDILNFEHSVSSLGDASTALLGYFHFIPTVTDSKAKQRRYEKNRNSVYYNSDLHFSRALFNNSLKSNGYVAIRQAYTDSINLNSFAFMNVDSILKYSSSDEAYIIGQKGKKYQLFYFPTANGEPTNLSDGTHYNFESVRLFMKDHSQELQNYLSSVLNFRSDTCSIRKNGTTPFNNIVFGGFIGQKKVATLLPDDYEPTGRKQ